MDNQKQLPLGEGGKPNLSTSAVQSDHDSKVRQVKKEPGDSVSSTRIKREEQSGVPCKVPRFQYVDFPSLHQCIKQLSVPPLEGWLASCPLGRTVPAHHPISPEEKVPKFKYVDYPSLYHCIQQLSVPPLEIWSSGLAKPSSSGIRGATVGQQSSSQVLREGRTKEDVQRNEAEQQIKKEKKNESKSHAPIPAQTVLQHQKWTDQSSTAVKGKNKSPVNTSQKLSDSRPKLNKATAKMEKCFRPSVISLVRTEGKKQRVEPQDWLEKQNCLGFMTKVERETDLEFICTSCQQMFNDPEELQTHWCSHKAKVSMADE